MMTVKELIAELQSFDDAKNVYVAYGKMPTLEIIGVVANKDIVQINAPVIPYPPVRRL